MGARLKTIFWWQEGTVLVLFAQVHAFLALCKARPPAIHHLSVAVEMLSATPCCCCCCCCICCCVGVTHAQVAGHFTTCSITVLEQRDGPQFIFGLDMLKRHQCVLDLAQSE
jgi:hypothetical protein